MRDLDYLWIIIIGMACSSFLERFVLILLQGRITIPVLMRRSLRFVPASALIAIVVPDLLYGKQNIIRIGAGLIAAVIAFRTKNILLTTGVGMIAFWILGALFIK